MNWTSFIPDLTVSLISAALAVGIGLATFKNDQKRKNRQLVHNLADDLASRRAFEPIDAFEGDGGVDAERCFSSVQAALERISAVRDEIRPNNDLRNELQHMVLSCVEYKDRMDFEPERWQFALMDLRGELVGSLQTVESIVGLPAGTLPEPGSTRAVQATV